MNEDTKHQGCVLAIMMTAWGWCPDYRCVTPPQCRTVMGDRGSPSRVLGRHGSPPSLSAVTPVGSSIFTSILWWINNGPRGPSVCLKSRNWYNCPQIFTNLWFCQERLSKSSKKIMKLLHFKWRQLFVCLLFVFLKPLIQLKSAKGLVSTCNKEKMQVLSCEYSSQY